MKPRPAVSSPLGRFSWALFDWANQPFFTVVTTFIFGPYFANVMVGDAVRGQAEWAFTQSTAGVLIAVLSPVLGAMADGRDDAHPSHDNSSHTILLECLAKTKASGSIFLEQTDSKIGSLIYDFAVCF